jgi:hypothetical protein
VTPAREGARRRRRRYPACAAHQKLRRSLYLLSFSRNHSFRRSLSRLVRPDHACDHTLRDSPQQEEQTHASSRSARAQARSKHEPARRGRPRAASPRHPIINSSSISSNNSTSSSSSTRGVDVRRCPCAPPRRPLFHPVAAPASTRPLAARAAAQLRAACPLRRAEEQAVRAPPRPPPHGLLAQAPSRVCPLPILRRRRQPARVFAACGWLEQLVHRGVLAGRAHISPRVQTAGLK